MPNDFGGSLVGLPANKPEMLPHYIPANGMALSVFDNKYAREKPDGSIQTFAERISEVVQGNFLLDPMWPEAYETRSWHNPSPIYLEYERLQELAQAGVTPFSGRHLQHGDLDQPNKLLEMHTNCATAMCSFMLFRLLLRGSGVGRDYSAACCRVNWDNMPNIRLVLDETHKDYNYDEFNGCFDSLKDARHKYDAESEHTRWFEVDDSREGWVKCIEILETAAFQGKHADKLFVFDFSGVRCSGSPIKGLQGRPSSGPLGLMRAMAKMASIKGAGFKPWKQALFIDHYLAACVQLGGARRSARMSVKYWKDRDVIEFVDVKRGGYLWSSNNSILVDAEFWEGAMSPRPSHARRVFEAIIGASYFDSTGEPGLVNIDKLVRNQTGMEKINGLNYLNPETYTDLHPRTRDMLDNILSHIIKLPYVFLVNPCGEIVLATYGAYCVIAETCMLYAKTLHDILDSVALCAKFLVRANLMKCDYAAEVKRTNRIGAGLTGIFEFAWLHFKLTFFDLISWYEHMHDPQMQTCELTGTIERVRAFWKFIATARVTVIRAANEISDRLGLVRPHTYTTIKPSGTISKVMRCTEGAHLPPMPYYIRWVQYHKHDADLRLLEERGYPVRDVGSKYPDHWIVGFPTKQQIADIMGDKLVTANQTTPEQNYKWLSLLEHYWIGPEAGNQVSYTLKYDTSKVSYEQFRDLVLEWQPKIKVCSVMPQDDWRQTYEKYGYVPEEPITAEKYVELMAKIDIVKHEGYDADQMACEGGVCPIEGDMRVSKVADEIIAAE